MAEETTEVAQEDSTPDTPAVSEGVDTPIEVLTAAEGEDATEDTEPSIENVPVDGTEELPQAIPAADAVDTSASSEASDSASSDAELPKEPDALQPYIDKAFETIQPEVEHDELDQFLRSHIKTFREEWDIWPDSAKDAYAHMMTSQLLQRKAAHTRIMNYEEFKLPVPSAQTKLFESIKQSQVKPKKCVPVLLLPPNLRPTYSLKR